MISRGTGRGRLGLGLAAAVLLGLAGCGAPGAQQTGADEVVTPERPTSPIALTLLDGAGNLTGNKVIYDNFAKAHPELVSGISYQTAPAPDVAGKVRAQQVADKVDISVVLGGPDVLGAGQTENLIMQLLPQYSSSLPDLSQVQDAASKELQDLSGGYGVLNRYNPNGPLLAFHPGTMSAPPTTPDELLAWAREHPGQFTYAQPANSGPGRTFMMSLPYMLGDSDPSDPVNGWSKTWAYLRELGKYVTSYPASSTIMNQQFGSGQLQLIPTIVSMDINSRRDGTWAGTDQVAMFADQHWIGDGHFMMIPKGVSPQTLYVALELIKFTLQPDQQALTYATGSLITANKNVKPSDAPADGQALLQQFGRPDFYPQALASGQNHPPLPPATMVKAFDLWQREVGSHVGS
ncbi:extracellular solute-binding protein [Pseudonocardia xinjiangensis]|uniref:extracellular solute-binding protein n=1 Tax=Pseudonocardia xinjiangensis TaxID=75289 RepID=UPI003D90398A